MDGWFRPCWRCSSWRPSWGPCCVEPPRAGVRGPSPRRQAGPGCQAVARLRVRVMSTMRLSQPIATAIALWVQHSTQSNWCLLPRVLASWSCHLGRITGFAGNIRERLPALGQARRRSLRMVVIYLILGTLRRYAGLVRAVLALYAVALSSCHFRVTFSGREVPMRSYRRRGGALHGRALLRPPAGNGTHSSRRGTAAGRCACGSALVDVRV